MADRQDDKPVRHDRDDAIQAVVEAALSAFAGRASVDRDAIEIVDARRVTWGDGAMGCPEPGMMYTQALVPGYCVHLRANGQEAYFHAGRDGNPRYCPADRRQAPVDAGNLD